MNNHQEKTVISVRIVQMYLQSIIFKWKVMRISFPQIFILLDSFYKRFSELKHRPPVVQAFHDLDSRSDRGKLSADRCIPVHAVNLKQSLQTKKILTNKITTTLLKTHDKEKKPLTANPSKVKSSY